jgi:DHA1 family bicyclomycin/chloramphenicol resistance-like MFS transporter
MVWGNAILLIGAIGCVITPSIPFLLGARFIQGIGASASAVVIFAMIADAYPAIDKAAKLIGVMNAALTTLMAAAPIAGGFINETVGWRGNYGVVALICAISWACLVFFLPETQHNIESFQLSKIQKDYRQLLTSMSFTCASVVPSLSYAGYLSFITQAPFLYTETYELSLMAYVLHQCVIISVFSLTSLFSGPIIQKLGARACITKGVFLSGLGASGMVFVSLVAPRSPYLMTFFMSLVGLGGAISYPAIFARSLEIFPDIKGTVSSVIMSMRSFLCFIFVAFTSYAYNRPLSKLMVEAPSYRFQQLS